MSEEEILSQDELDALSGKNDKIAAKEELYDGDQVLAYDFKRPEHTKQNHFPTLQLINEKTAFELKEKLGFMLQQKLEVSPQEIVINKYGEFINSLNIPIDIKRIKIPEMKGSFLVCFDDPLINAVIDEYFGAPQALPSHASTKASELVNESSAEAEESKSQQDRGENDQEESYDDVFDDEVKEEAEVVFEKEEFTNAETRISDKLLAYLLESMSVGWSLLSNYSFELEQSENNPRLINYLEYEDLIVNINFELEIRNTKM